MKDNELKYKIVNLIREHHNMPIDKIAHELYITVTTAKIYASMALAEQLVKFNRETKEYYFDFETETFSG